jgi:hypothetical protein
MITSIYFEVFSTGMKARLDPKYRRLLELGRHPELVEFRRDLSQNVRETALPFTTKTKAYGTYVGRK